MLKTYKKWAPFRACHGFVREDDNIRSVIHVSMLSCFLSVSGFFAFSYILYPLPHCLTLQSSYCWRRWHRAYQVSHSTDMERLGGLFTPDKLWDAARQHYESTFPLIKTWAELYIIPSFRLRSLWTFTFVHHTCLPLAMFRAMYWPSVSAFPHATHDLVTKSAVSDGDSLCI